MTKTWINSETWVDIEHADDNNVVRMLVDDYEIAVSGDQTILEAVSRFPGIGNIPALCYHPAVKAYGACRLCTVEVSEDEGKRFRFVAACLYPVKSGLIVKTNTPTIKSLRKGILELLLARAPNVDRIKELADEYGVEKPRFTSSDEECILCGLCVRACEESIGKSAIGMVNRGVYRAVAAPFKFELGPECIGCGDCVYICPTAAIKMGPDSKVILPEFE